MVVGNQGGTSGVVAGPGEGRRVPEGPPQVTQFMGWAASVQRLEHPGMFTQFCPFSLTVESAISWDPGRREGDPEVGTVGEGCVCGLQIPLPSLCTLHVEMFLKVLAGESAHSTLHHVARKDGLPPPWLGGCSPAPPLGTLWPQVLAVQIHLFVG